MNELKMRPGPTYTMSFWSISPLIDNVMWRIGGVIPGMTVDFNQFAGRPPVHLVVYTLRPQPPDSKDERHLDSRKCYLFHLAFWSSLSQPPSFRLRQLVPRLRLLKLDAKSSNGDAGLSPRSSGLQGAALHASRPANRQEKQSFFSCFE